jgi:hypothetical protein
MLSKNPDTGEQENGENQFATRTAEAEICWRVEKALWISWFFFQPKGGG